VTLWCAERRCAIIGDAVLDWGVPDDTGRLIAPPPYYDLDAYLTTILALETLDADTTFTSHYGILDRDGSRRLLQNSRDAVSRLDTALETAFRERPAGWTLADLCLRAGELAQHWEPPLWPALCDPISAHLLRLLSSGKITRTTRNGRRIYHPPDAR
jgi:hypothetical protein